jgi:hypothetical protein
MMPQNNVLPDWRATYPNDAPVQKPGGVTVATTATAPRVPNKPTYSAGTIQAYDPDLGQMVFDKVVDAIQDRVEEASAEEAATENSVPHTQDQVEEAVMEEAEEDDGDDEDGKPRRTTTRTTRTTTRRR